MTPFGPDLADPAARKIATEICIARDIEHVWAVLIGFANYEHWNPYIVRIDGEAKAGSRIAVHSMRSTAQPPLVQWIDIVSVAPFTMRWQGGLPDRGEFAGDHWFELERAGHRETRFSHYEHFSGSRMPEFIALHEMAVAENFDRFNLALKARCESGQAERFEGERIECNIIAD